MKIRLSLLRKLVREELTRTLVREAYKVTYIGKDGKPASTTFPDRKLADMYASTLKGASVQLVDTEIPDVAVQKVRAASLDDLRQSSKSFYKQAQAGEKFAPRETPKMRSSREREDALRGEQEAELEAEFWMDSRAAGQSQEDAFNDLDYIRSRRR